MSSRLLLVATTLLAAGMPALAQTQFGFSSTTRVEAPTQPEAIPLYPNAASGPSHEIWYRAGDQYIVRNVSQPTLTPVLPEPGKATGTAVIVAPGGAFMQLMIDREGRTIARQLADWGIAAFVLKYRLDPTPEDDKEFRALFERRKSQPVVPAASARTVDAGEMRAVDDALSAVRVVRTNAAKWGINPRRVGIMGFSAGAMIAVKAGVAPVADDRPDFIALFYPSLAAVDVPIDAPPMFAGLAFDDPYFGKQELGLIEAWRSAGRPVEFHGYESGGHGFGLGKPGTTSALAFDEFLLWMRSRDLLCERSDRPLAIHSGYSPISR
jgi:acetyl esterase/lipase